MKRFVVGLVIVVFVLITGLIALPFLIPTDTIRAAVERRVEEQTGRKLALAGDIKRSIFPNIGVEVTDVTLANADWAQEPIMISAKRAVISVKLLPLLSRQIEVSGLVLEDPVINLEIGPNGEKNWDLLPQNQTGTASPAAGDEGGEAAVKDISLAGVRITNGTVRFADSQTNERQEATSINLELSLKGLDQPFIASGDLVWNSEPVSLALDLETPAKIIGQQETRIKFDLTSKPAKLAFDGTLTPLPYSPQIDGTFEVNIPSTASLAKWAGQALPPELADLQSIAFKGAARYTFDGLDIDTGGNIVYKNNPAEFKLKAKSAGDPMGGTPVEIDSEISSDLITASYRGTATLGIKPLATGSFSLNTPSPIALAQWLGQEVPPELADLSAIDVTGEIDLAADRLAATVNGKANYKGQAVALALDAKSDGDPLAGSPVTLTTRITSELLTASYAGTVSAGDALAVAGKYSLKTPSPKAVAAWLGQSAKPELADLGAIDLSGNIEMTPVRFKATAKGSVTYKSEPITLTLNASAKGQPQNGTPVATRLVATSNRFNVDYQGSIVGGAKPKINGKLTFNTDSLADLATWAGAGLGPQGAALGKTSLVTQIAANPQRAVLKEMVLNLDDMVVKGKLQTTLSGRPNIGGTLDINALDLDRLLPQTAAPSPSGSPSRGWSDEPIDYSGLKAVDANLRLSTQALRVQGLNIGPSRLHLVLKDGLLSIDVQEINLYGGRGVGKISLDAGQPTPRLTSTFTLTALQLRPFLKDAAGFKSLAGTGGFSLSITSSGLSQKQLASNLNGKGNINFIDGALYGINIPAMLRNVSTAFLDSSAGKEQKTDFAKLTASFNIVKGQLSNQDLSLQGPLLRALGQGVVDIAAQRLDFRIDPKAVASLTGQGGTMDLAGITVPILIKGAWSNLKFKPDLSGLVDGLLGNPQGALGAAKGLLQGDPKDLLKGQGAGNAVQGVLQGVVGKNPDSPGAKILDSVLGTKQPKSAAPQPSGPGALDRGGDQTSGQPLSQPQSKKKKRKKKVRKLLNSIFD